MQDGPGQNEPGASGALIVDAGLETFASEVIEASMTMPVLVDFWAPWCQPCKTLTPALENAVNAAGGAVKLVKVNIDENKEIATQLRIQSVPTVYAFKDGKPVDGFQGAIPDSQLKAFIEKLIGGELGQSPLEQLLEHGAEALEAGELSAAEQAFGAALQEDQQNISAIAGLAKTYIAMGNLENAEQLLALTPKEHEGNTEIAAARAAFELAKSATEDHGDTAELVTAIEKNPKDHDSRFELAEALLAKNDREGAVEHLLMIVELDRTWNDEAARKKLVTLFEAFGPADPVTVSARRQLSSILFS